MLETAIVLPAYFLILLGCLEFGIVFSGYGNCTFASRAAARYAALHSTASLAPCDTACVSGFVTTYLYAAPSGGATITTTYSSSNVVGSTVTVAVKIAYPLKIPFYTSLTAVSVGSKTVRLITR